MTLKTFIHFTLLLCFINQIEGDVIVNTKSGKVEGKEVQSILKGEKYYSFKGIPYAKPPVGALRFMAPEPHSGWDNILDARKERKHCAIYNLPVRNIKNYGFCGDEDCLHLSVHTPKLPETSNPNLPVIVFLYNELFRITFNDTKDYGPDFFMKENVILININYRLGSLGFLSFEDDLLPGNNGLRDVILALKWVKENIKSFGGDPDRITLMGNQGGAAIVDILLHSPKAKGLFSAAIMQSGTSWYSSYFNGKARQKATTFAEEIDEPSTTSSYLLKRFANVPASRLTEYEPRAVHADEARAIQKGVPAFGPVIEHDHPDAVITELPEKSPKMDIPIMIGFNSREAMEASLRFLHKPQYLTFADRDFLVIFPIRVDYHFKLNSNIYRQVVKELKEFYFDEGYVKISKPGEYITYLNDIMSFYPVDYTVRMYTNSSSSNVYYYMFDYSGDFNIRKKQGLESALTIDGTWGASVTDELCYLFVCNSIRKTYIKALADEDSEEIKIMRNMVRLWTNFAKNRNPTPPGDEFTWTPASKENKECLVITDELQMKEKIYDEKVKFWDEFIAKYKELAVDGVVDDIKDEL